MDTIKKILGTIFAFLFIVTALSALILFNIDRTAFTAGTYQKAFAGVDLYNKLPAIMAESMVSGAADQGGLPVVIRDMSPQSWEAFFRALLPQDILKTMTDDALNSIFAYLNMDTNSAQLSLNALKTGMVSEKGVQAVFTILKTLPDCTLQQIGQITLGLLGDGGIQFCNPPQEMLPFLTPLIQGQLQTTALALPDQVTLISAPAENNDPRPKLQSARLVMRLSPLVPLGFLLLMTLVAANSLKSLLGWCGVPFFITGLLATLIGLGGAPLTRILLNQMKAGGNLNSLPAVIQGYAGSLVSEIVRALLVPVLWQGIVLAGLGLFLLMGGVMLRKEVKNVTKWLD